MYEGKIYIAGDHGGYQLKKRIVRYIENELMREVEDMGAHEYIETDDYPDFAIPLAKKVAQENARGILICKNGIGVCITANKIKNIRAGIGYNMMAAETMMQDDNTNILCLASKGLTEDHALSIVKIWLDTPFSDAARHLRRLDKIRALES